MRRVVVVVGFRGHRAAGYEAAPRSYEALFGPPLRGPKRAERNAPFAAGRGGGGRGGGADGGAERLLQARAGVVVERARRGAEGVRVRAGELDDRVHDVRRRRGALEVRDGDGHAHAQGRVGRHGMHEGDEDIERGVGVRPQRVRDERREARAQAQVQRVARRLGVHHGPEALQRDGRVVVRVEFLREQEGEALRHLAADRDGRVEMREHEARAHEGMAAAPRYHVAGARAQRIAHIDHRAEEALHGAVREIRVGVRGRTRGRADLAEHRQGGREHPRRLVFAARVRDEHVQRDGDELELQRRTAHRDHVRERAPHHLQERRALRARRRLTRQQLHDMAEQAPQTAELRRRHVLHRAVVVLQQALAHRAHHRTDQLQDAALHGRVRAQQRALAHAHELVERRVLQQERPAVPHIDKHMQRAQHDAEQARRRGPIERLPQRLEREAVQRHERPTRIAQILRERRLHDVRMRCKHARERLQQRRIRLRERAAHVRLHERRERAVRAQPRTRDGRGAIGAQRRVRREHMHPRPRERGHMRRHERREARRERHARPRADHRDVHVRGGLRGERRVGAARRALERRYHPTRHAARRRRIDARAQVHAAHGDRRRAHVRRRVGAPRRRERGRELRLELLEQARLAKVRIRRLGERLEHIAQHLQALRPHGAVRRRARTARRPQHLAHAAAQHAPIARIASAPHMLRARLHTRQHVVHARQHKALRAPPHRQRLRLGVVRRERHRRFVDVAAGARDALRAQRLGRQQHRAAQIHPRARAHRRGIAEPGADERANPLEVRVRIQLAQQRHEQRRPAVAREPRRAALRHLAVRTRGRRSEARLLHGVAQHVGPHARRQHARHDELESLQADDRLRHRIASVVREVQQERVQPVPRRFGRLQLRAQHTHQRTQHARDAHVRRQMYAQIAAAHTPALRLVRRRRAQARHEAQRALDVRLVRHASRLGDARERLERTAVHGRVRIVRERQRERVHALGQRRGAQAAEARIHLAQREDARRPSVRVPRIADLLDHAGHLRRERHGAREAGQVAVQLRGGAAQHRRTLLQRRLRDAADRRIDALVRKARRAMHRLRSRTHGAQQRDDAVRHHGHPPPRLLVQCGAPLRGLQTLARADLHVAAREREERREQLRGRIDLGDMRRHRLRRARQEAPACIRLHRQSIQRHRIMLQRARHGRADARTCLALRGHKARRPCVQGDVVLRQQTRHAHRHAILHGPRRRALRMHRRRRAGWRCVLGSRQPLDAQTQQCGHQRLHRRRLREMRTAPQHARTQQGRLTRAGRAALPRREKRQRLTLQRDETPRRLGRQQRVAAMQEERVHAAQRAETLRHEVRPRTLVHLTPRPIRPRLPPGVQQRRHLRAQKLGAQRRERSHEHPRTADRRRCMRRSWRLAVARP